jgi:hypothetical protein
MAGTLNVTGQIPTTAQTLAIAPPQIVYSAPIGSITAVNLVSGANTITIPTGTTTIIIQPPITNTVVLTLKGVTGDTGITISLTNIQVIQPTATTTSFVITAASTTTGLTYITFI